MGTFEIFSYWNIKELQLVFNAVAAITGSSDFNGLVRTLALVGVISLGMAVLAGFSQLPDFGRWLVMFAVFNAILLVPKVTVVITDQTGTQQPVTVANVPLGLASFAHSISHIGNWLTTTFETTFSLPNDIQFRTNGTLWGHRVQQEMLHTKFDNAVLSSNLLEFYRECIIPEFATGYVVASDMAKSNDIWAYLNGRTNPGRLVTIRDTANPGNMTTYSCDNAYTVLTGQINADNQNQMMAMGKRLYPNLPSAQANLAIQSAIQTSTNYMLNISASAMDTVKQTAMSNFMIDAQYMLPAQIGDTASATSNLAQAQAIRSTSESYRLMAKLAESTMPKIKNMVELVQYAIFPIILLIVLMAGHKGGLVLKSYAMSLVWVQLWPPLYAVMHMIMTMHAQEFAQMTQGMGLSMSQYSVLNNAYISDEAIAGMLSATAIPGIAWAIVSGAAAGTAAIAGMTTPARESERIASGMATGNVQMGNASLGNQSFNNVSGMQYNTRPTITRGGYQSEGSDFVKHKFGSEDHIIDSTGALQNIGAHIKWNGETTGTLTQMSQSMETAARQETVSASESMTAAKNQFNDLQRTHGKGTRAGTTDSTGSTAQFLKATETEIKLAEKFGRERGIKQEQMAEYTAYARADASGGVNILGTGATVGAGTQASGKSGAGTSQVQKVAHELAQTKEYKEAVQKADTASRQKDFATGEDAGSKAARGIRASMDESRSHLKTAAANHTTAQTYAAAATKTRQVGAGFEVLADNMFMKHMTGQINPETKKNFTENDVQYMVRHNRKAFSQYASGYVNDVLVPEALKDIPAPSNTVAATHENNKGEIPGTEDVTSFNRTNQSAVAIQQGRAGVNPNKGPKNEVSPVVDQMLNRASQQINLGSSGITDKGQPLKDSVTANTDPTRQNNMGLAAQNAAASVLPEGTMKLLDAGGMVSADAGVAKPSADKYKGDLVDAAIDTAIFAGSMAIGGPVGGKVVSKLGGEAANVAARAGRAGREAAEDSTRAVTAATERSLAEKGMEKELAAMTSPEGRAAAEAAAVKAGANAEVKAAKTVDDLGKAAGVAGGGVAANQVTGEDGYVQNSKEAAQAAVNTVRDTDRAVMEVVDDLTGQNEPPAPGRVSSGKIKHPSAEPGSAAAGNGGEGASTAEKGPREDAITPNSGQTPTSR